jgi:hypothetical protein
MMSWSRSRIYHDDLNYHILNFSTKPNHLTFIRHYVDTTFDPFSSLNELLKLLI